MKRPDGHDEFCGQRWPDGTEWNCTLCMKMETEAIMQDLDYADFGRQVVALMLEQTIDPGNQPAPTDCPPNPLDQP
jgi:hypothetical protein